MEVVSLKEFAESRWIADDNVVVTEHEAPPRQRRRTLQLPYTATDAQCEVAEQWRRLQLPEPPSSALPEPNSREMTLPGPGSLPLGLRTFDFS